MGIKFWIFVNGLKKGQKKFGENIAAVVNLILLSVVYIIGVGLTSVFAKVAKKKFLELKIDEECKSYWADLDLTKKHLEEYYRQF